MRFFFALALLCLLAPAVALAQNVQLSGLQDVNFGQWYEGAGSLSFPYNTCMFRDDGNDRWRVTGYGSGAGSAFTLSDGIGNTMDYSVSAPKNLTPGSPNNERNADTDGSTCPINGPQMEVEVQIHQNDLGSVPPGVYTGTVTLSVEPR